MKTHYPITTKTDHTGEEWYQCQACKQIWSKSDDYANMVCQVQTKRHLDQGKRLFFEQKD